MDKKARLSDDQIIRAASLLGWSVVGDDKGGYFMRGRDGQTLTTRVGALHETPADAAAAAIRWVVGCQAVNGETHENRGRMMEATVRYRYGGCRPASTFESMLRDWRTHFRYYVHDQHGLEPMLSAGEFYTALECQLHKLRRDEKGGA